MEIEENLCVCVYTLTHMYTYTFYKKDKYKN